jgi:pyridoxamine 5'-phosphate oxidase
MSVADLRQSYEKSFLLEADASASPFEQFSRWFDQALAASVPEPNAMTLATVNSAGQPSARIVLIKGYDETGFVFYTNYESRKGHELLAQSHAALLFFWQPLERQIRIEGVVEKVSDAMSDAYFHSRPLSSRIGAWASSQSQETTRESLENQQRECAERFGDSPPRPAHWGGYRVVPHAFEFWQGRRSRLHDRLSYTLGPDATWSRVRLSP